MQISGIFLIFCLDKSENVCYNNRVGGGICSWRLAETCGYPVDKSLLDRKTYIASVLHCLAPAASSNRFGTALSVQKKKKKKKNKNFLSENENHYENENHLHFAPKKWGENIRPAFFNISLL